MEPASHNDVSASTSDELGSRLDELSDQEERLRLESEGKSVVEIADRLLPQSCLQAVNLVWIKNNPIYRVALEEYESRRHLCSERLGKWEQSIERAQNVIFQVVGVFFVFQGFLLIAVTTPARCDLAGLSHESRLYLIIASLAASLMTILVVTRKFNLIRSFTTTISYEEQALKEAVTESQQLRRSGYRYKFKDREYRAPKLRCGFGPPTGVPWMYIGAVFVLYNMTWVFPLAVWRISK